MINFKNLEEVEKAFPADSTIIIRGKPILITGYYFNGIFWCPINIVETDTDNLPIDYFFELMENLNDRLY